MVTESLLVNRSALCTFLIFRTGSRRAIPAMARRLLVNLGTPRTLFVLGTSGGGNIPFMA